MVVMDVLDDLVHRCRVDGKAEYDHVGGLCGGLMRGCCLKQNIHFDVSRSKTFVAPTANNDEAYGSSTLRAIQWVLRNHKDDQVFRTLAEASSDREIYHRKTSTCGGLGISRRV